MLQTCTHSHGVSRIRAARTPCSTAMPALSSDVGCGSGVGDALLLLLLLLLETWLLADTMELDDLMRSMSLFLSTTSFGTLGADSKDDSLLRLLSRSAMTAEADTVEDAIKDCDTERAGAAGTGSAVVGDAATAVGTGTGTGTGTGAAVLGSGGAGTTGCAIAGGAMIGVATMGGAATTAAGDGALTGVVSVTLC